MSAPIKIIVADDHEVVLEGFVAMFKTHDDFLVVGQATNGKSLVQIVTEEQPDVVITDIKMPEMDGIEATRTILKKFPKIAVVGISAFNYSYMIIDMLNAGAIGFVSKASTKEVFYQAVREAFAGRFYYCTDIRKMVSELTRQGKFDPRNKQAVAFTPIQMRIIECICKEMTQQQVVEELSISGSTFKRFRLEIMDIMDVQTNQGIIKFAINNGIFRQ